MEAAASSFSSRGTGNSEGRGGCCGVERHDILQTTVGSMCAGEKHSRNAVGLLGVRFRVVEEESIHSTLA